ncbi:glutaminyl-peptide cyclotransferase [Pseudonocardia sp.]|uniref:glutaminyl-peptide cyclotransferase n=1 Tax=Pseudonocardia sp. TaxID=60912 RepID=UPI002605E447|nr:glutaminyl-peptide cyclotransferase [Pseudonocardia sp.]MCW2720404.1 glutamine cyclotransferase [Pseudonocardia sp.]
MARRRTLARGGGVLPVGRALAAAAVLLLAGCAAASPTPGASSTVPVLRPQVLAETPHDASAFTEGFELDQGVLWEGTGLAGKSQLRELDPATGAVRRAASLPGQLFGEGISVVGDTVWQLTYQDHVMVEWDRATLTVRRQLPFADEGWGMCTDGARLIRSDGTATLHFQDPTTFAAAGSVDVTLDGQPVTELNELDCSDGQVWANVWRTDRIVRIDPATGRVTAVVDASGLLTAQQRATTDVLNGIASVGGGEYLLTGKFWPTTFRVRFVPSS